MKSIYLNLSLILLLFGAVSYSQTGSIDLTFGENGYLRNIPGAGKSIQVNTDQDIFIRGKSSLIKCNPEGEIDQSFGNNGTVEYNLYNLESSSTDMLIQDDGKIVLVGDIVDGATTYIYVLRSNTNGFIDTTFGNNGVFIFSTGNNDYSKTIIQTSDNAFFVGCQTESSTTTRDFMLLKLKPNGALDSNFGNNGVIITDMYGKDDFLQTVTTDSNNNIYALGHVLFPSPVNGISYFDFGLIKYTPNGTIDSTFGTNGKANYNLDYYSSSDFPNYIKVNDDNSIYVAGYTSDNEGGDYQIYKLAKLDSNGNLDNSFGNQGVVSIFARTIVLPSQPVTQVNNKLLVSAFEIFFQGQPTYKSLMKRVNTNGTIDTDFASAGILELDSDFYPRRELVFQSHDKLLTLGGNADGSGTVLVRINIDDNILNVNEEQLTDHTITLLPNPSSEFIFINSSQNDSTNDLEIYSISGKKLKSFKNISLNNYRVNVSAFASGVYVIKIKNGTKKITLKKFIIK
ncbi:T9SS type A sorting domain-containing protein [Bizionia paragorgiae]|uniref:T9SS type A sorting domain-containing protein n=1 Tax=Bizionia paragorgiae TaxID=283786 RepID=UPI003A8CC7FE